MEPKDKKFLIVGVALIVGIMIVAALILRQKTGSFIGTPPVEQPSTPVPEKQFNVEINENTPCPGPEIKYRMVDASMAGLVEKDKEVTIVTNHFACNPIEKGQLVLYRFSGSMDPVIRRVVAVEGDTFKLQKDAKKRNWNLLINGQPMKTQTGETYGFGFDAPPTLSLYEAPRKGKLAKDEVLVFCSTPPSEKDSGAFGLTSKSDMVGLVKAE